MKTQKKETDTTVTWNSIKNKVQQLQQNVLKTSFIYKNYFRFGNSVQLSNPLSPLMTKARIVFW